MAPLRVLHLIQSATQIYGAERCLLLELRALREHGHDARALLVHETRMGEAAGVLEAALREQAIPTERVQAKSPISPGLLLGLLRALGRLRPDVVHSHSLKTDVLGLPLARLLGVPFVIELHGYLHPDDDARVRFYERLDQRALRHADAVLVLSRDYERKTWSYGVSPRRVHLVPSGIDTRGLRASPPGRGLRRELGIPEQAITLGMVARLSAEKGHADFLTLLAALVRRGRSVVGVLFGEGPLRQALEQQAAQLGITGSLRFAGYVDAVADAYRALDVLVSCSRFEGLPLNLIEAMALGVPVAAMATGGCAEIVESGETGLVVPAGDVAALTDAVDRLVQDRSLRQRLGAAAQTRAEARFSLTAWATQAADVYRAAMAHRARKDRFRPWRRRGAASDALRERA